SWPGAPATTAASTCCSATATRCTTSTPTKAARGGCSRASTACPTPGWTPPGPRSCGPPPASPLPSTTRSRSACWPCSATAASRRGRCCRTPAWGSTGRCCWPPCSSSAPVTAPAPAAPCCCTPTAACAWWKDASTATASRTARSTCASRRRAEPLVPPAAEAAHRQVAVRPHRAAGHQRLEDRLDEAVGRGTQGTLAVGAEVGQPALLVPDRHRRAGRQTLAAGQAGQRLQGLQVVRQAPLAAGPAHGVELHAAAGTGPHQLAKVLLVADVARAGRVPEVHQADRAGPGQLRRQAQLVAHEQLGALLERADVARLEPPEGGQHGAQPEGGDETGEQFLAADGHGRKAGGRKPLACHAAPDS